MALLHGSIWWADLPDIGDRPALVVSNESLNRALQEVTVARVTALERDRSLPSYVALEPDEVEGLPERSFVICHNVHTLPKTALRASAGRLRPGRMLQVEDALRYVLDLA